MEGERLQKVMAHAGVASRRKSEELITQGLVKVNDQLVTELGVKVSPDDVIEVNGKLISQEKKIYLLLYKPYGYITTVNDPYGRKTVLDLVQDIKQRIYPVGRLDNDTSGLLILTNDGELTYKLTHPSYEVDKTYLVEVAGQPSAGDFRRLEKGVYLEDGLTAPAKVSKIKKAKRNTSFEITIHEGRNRQVRRMCESLGYPVEKLIRIKLSFLTLQGLSPGECRFLKQTEVSKLKKTN